MTRFFTLILVLFAFSSVAFAQCPHTAIMNSNQNRLFLSFSSPAEALAYFNAAGGNASMIVNPGGLGTLFQTANSSKLRIDITTPPVGPYLGTITSLPGLSCTYENGELQVALPISLTSFTAKKMEHSILLEWTTEREIDNDYIIIERSIDGKDFKQLAYVSGNGTSSGDTYSFEDKTPMSTTNYYRLHQVDYDGTESLSKIVTMDFADPRLGAHLKLYPTMVKEEINLDLTDFDTDENVAIEIINATGHVVLNRSIINSEIISLSLSELNLIDGMYFVRCRLANEIVEGKFLVVK